MRIRALAAALLSTTLVPGALSAQACLGLPSADGQIAVAGAATLMDGEVRPGGEFHVDVTGPASFRAEYDHGHDDGVGRTFSVLGGYELFLLEPSICAVAGALYTTDPAPQVDERLGISAGFGIGKTLRTERLTATVYAVPRYVRLQETVTDLAGVEETVGTNELLAEAGVTVGLAPLYVGGAVVLSTFGEADAGFRIRVGILF